MNDDKGPWDYWRTPDPERTPMPQPPEGATHARWSESLTEWYFWRVNGSGYYHYYGYWVPHKRQEDAMLKLARQLKEGTAVYLPDYEPEPEQNEEGSCTMNLENAALLVRDDITTVQVTFGDGHEFTYILHSSIPAEPGDRVLVPAKNDLRVATVIKVDQEAQINVNSNTKYKWVICNVEKCLNAVKTEQEATDTIARALKQRQAANVREQILQQFGVSSHTELMALGQDNSQGG